MIFHITNKSILYSLASTMTQLSVLQHRGGLDFDTLSKGEEKCYSASYLINLDPDLLQLIE